MWLRSLWSFLEDLSRGDRMLSLLRFVPISLNQWSNPQLSRLGWSNYPFPVSVCLHRLSNRWFLTVFQMNLRDWDSVGPKLMWTSRGCLWVPLCQRDQQHFLPRLTQDLLALNVPMACQVMASLLMASALVPFLWLGSELQSFLRPFVIIPTQQLLALVL